MSDKLRVVICLCAVGAVGFVAPAARGCMVPTPPIEPPPRVFTDRHSPTDYWVWVELRTVFNSGGQVHSCSCGLGLASPLPSGVTIGNGVTVGYYDTATMTFVEAISEFTGLAPSAASTQGWTAGPPIPDPLTGSPLVNNWFGYGGQIQPVAPRPLGPNEIFVMCFQFEVPANFVVTGSIDAQIGGGLGNSDLSPMFGMRPDPDSHLASYSNAFAFPIPAPSVASMLVVLGATMRRRRR
jgi:hypothetical protein